MMRRAATVTAVEDGRPTIQKRSARPQASAADFSRWTQADGATNEISIEKRDCGLAHLHVTTVPEVLVRRYVWQGVHAWV
jgi:hypothetical protein